MSSRRRNQAVQPLLYRISTLPRRVLKALVTYLLRVLLLWGRRPATSRAGFILPTTVLLLLVTSLAVGSITLRTYTRTQQTIGDRQQQVIYNAATPALDRAKAKLEYLFSREDPRLPANSQPDDATLYAMLRNDGTAHTISGTTRTLPVHEPPDTAGNPTDPYLFPDESRIDFDDDGDDDNAWSYAADTNGDGVNDALVAYSIVFNTPVDASNAPNPGELKKQSGAALEDRAARLEIRNAPLSVTSVGQCASASGVTFQNGWFTPPSGSTAASVKNFQVDAIIIPGEFDAGGNFVAPNPNATISTLELQQDRKIDQGNKWGAWFKDDLEIFPAPKFRWNGAMHTEGSLIVGSGLTLAAGDDDDKATRFLAYLISSKESCLNTSADASEVTVGLHTNQPGGTSDFYGQVINGQVTEVDNGTETTEKSAFHIFRPGADPVLDQTLNNDDDSITNGPLDATEDIFTLDPVKLLTANIYEQRQPNANAADAADVDPQREDRWQKSDQVDEDPLIEGRIFNKEQPTPTVGDSYRADNRYGPQALYIEGVTSTVGKNISSLTAAEIDPTVVTDPLATVQNRLQRDGAPNQTDVGLDGYWERRARNDGMRIIVGQRLELGDAFGWKGETDDPLKPWAADSCAKNPNNPIVQSDANKLMGGCYGARQRRTLRDNLAAIQSTVAYHATPFSATPVNDGDFPQACLITTVHPGTPETLRQASTFVNLAAGLKNAGLDELWDNTWFDVDGADNGVLDPKPLISNPFTGQGTNGWEYNFFTDASVFESSGPVFTALQNLANYAGDPKGGAPSFAPVQDTDVHPDPDMTMWGDFSSLRRIVGTGGLMATPSAAAYAALSPADKTTLHTAACTLGMLAYNMAYLEQADINSADPAINSLRTELNSILTTLTTEGVANNVAFTVDLDGDGNPENLDVPDAGDLDGDNVIDPSPEAYTATLEAMAANEAGTPVGDRLELLTRFAKLVALQEQIKRDRANGYQTASACISELCTDQPKYPILHSLFPDFVAGDHSEQAGMTRDGATLPTYIDNENSAVTYTAIDLTDSTVLDAIALAPKPAAAADWSLPINTTPTTPGTGNFPYSNQGLFVRQCDTEACNTATLIQVALKDSALFDGRQMMNVRVLDLDLDLLRTEAFTAADTWLPRSGVVYAFREDGVREDAIVRPADAGATAADCDTDSEVQTAAICKMRAGAESALASKDPPLAARNYSVKPVDYAPDPDRRVSGFRLLNGEKLGRTGDNGRGMSFISDDSVYIWGDFNKHQDNAGNFLEEFKDLAAIPHLRKDQGYKFFYARTETDPNFATANNDLWRPTEILADSVTILSANFCDGSVEDGFLTSGQSNIAGNPPNDATTIPGTTVAKYGCAGSGDKTSYLSMLRPAEVVAANAWQRENPYDPDSPIAVSRHGNPLIEDAANPLGVDYADEYYGLKPIRAMIVAPDEATVNATIISGIVPSRKNQSYGGLHNFPRFLEYWDDKNLFMSGSFIQLNFSSSATGPYDQDAWQPTETPSKDEEMNNYYSPPVRRWGYDVALQMAPAAPIAQRFLVPSRTRSEFYSEPSVEDPYIAQLCRAATGAASICPAAN